MLKQKTTKLQPIKHPLFDAQQLQVFVKREDQNHQQIQGNKLYKLELNLKEHLNLNKKFLLTFGGAYSNHLAATAAACQQLQITAIAIVRGAELAEQTHKWSLTLQIARRQGMQLVFVSREDYRQKHTPHFMPLLFDKYASQLSAATLAALQTAMNQQQISLLPEGGSNNLAVQGFAPLCTELEQQCPAWDALFCAVGTGATLAGLVANCSYKPHRRIYGVAVLKQAEYLIPQIDHWIERNQSQAHTNQWQLLSEFHHGGYAKKSTELQNFITQTWHEIKTEEAIDLEPIYSGKAFYAFWHKLRHGEFAKGSKIILLHSGGLQGLQRSAISQPPSNQPSKKQNQLGQLNT